MAEVSEQSASIDTSGITAMPQPHSNLAVLNLAVLNAAELEYRCI